MSEVENGATMAEKYPNQPTESITQDLNEMHQNSLESKIRQDAAHLVLGRIFGSFVSDLQAQAGEIAVLRSRIEKGGV